MNLGTYSSDFLIFMTQITQVPELEIGVLWLVEVGTMAVERLHIPWPGVN